MAAVQGWSATQYAQIVAGPLNDVNFTVTTLVAGVRPEFPNVPHGKTAFTGMTTADTIMYRAVSLSDPSKWEVGIGTYDSTDGELDRSDANVVASSNSNNTVNFDGDQVLVEGIEGFNGSLTFAITNWTSDVAMDCNTAADAELADVLGTVIKALIDAGILKGSVSA